jgi:hypothetical protein
MYEEVCFMPLDETTPDQQRNLWQGIAAGFCCLLGLAIIINTQPMGDGMWFWYAKLLRGGLKLYAEQHLALQPLFILETELFQRIFGDGWLVSKIAAVLHLVAYVACLFLIIRYLRWSDRQKALLLVCVFLESIYFNAYRFDDYHILADCFQVYAVYILLVLASRVTFRQIAPLATLLGVLCGLSFTTRVNDGGALLVTVAFAASFIVRSKRFLSTLLLVAAAGLTVVLVVALTGDSLHDYALNSIFRAATSKGGAASVLQAPLRLPWMTVKSFLENFRLAVLLLYALSWSALIGWFIRNGRGRFSRGRIIAVVFGIAVLSIPLAHQILVSHETGAISGFFTLVTMVVDLAILIRLVMASTGSRPASWNPLELVLLVPSGQLASGSMSSGGHFETVCTPIAVIYMLLALVAPLRPRKSWQVGSYLTLGVLMAAFIIPYKIHLPFIWHTYVSKTMFTGRTWYRHPLYGPMYIERENLDFIRPTCEKIHSVANPELLSLPYPYANYFCGVAPWHNAVLKILMLSLRISKLRLLTGFFISDRWRFSPCTRGSITRGDPFHSVIWINF